MSVRNAGNTIREARNKAGLTQTELSEGICSPLSLSRIENGTAGVSPSTFQALMAHSGAPCEIYPVFENWNDYECFFHLKHARFHLDSWQLEAACGELNKVEERKWNNNKYYYQEWLLLQGMLQFRSGLTNHAKLYTLYLDALHISRPNVSLSDFRALLLSVNEIELLLGIAQEALYLNQVEICLDICTQIYSYLASSQITFLEKDRLLAQHAIVYSKYLFAAGDYTKAFQFADTNRHQMVVDRHEATLFELTFLTGLGSYYLDKMPEALGYFKSTFYSAHAIKSPYATTCRNYVCQHLTLKLPDNLLALPDIPFVNYPIKEIIDTSDFSDGIYDFYGADVVTIGTLIHEFRIRQKVSQRILCQGLCSPSKLSKIESGIIQPSIILAETLLQRLGFSEREFVFWGDSTEARFYDLKFKLMRNRNLPGTDNTVLLHELEEFVSDADILYQQFYLYMKSRHSKLPTERMELLKRALDCTLKNFDIYNIGNYRLSWMELTILNNIANEYLVNSSYYQGSVIFQHLLEYNRANTPDIILQSQTLTITIYRLFYLLYAQEHYKEITDLYMQLDLSILRYDIVRYGGLFFFYSQALGECSKYDQIALWACYSCGIENIREAHANEIALATYIQNDFSISINY